MCKDTITTEVAWSWPTNGEDELGDFTLLTIAADIEASIEEWETAVRWVANGTNIVSATATERETCTDNDNNPVKFIPDHDIKEECTVATAFGCVSGDSSDMQLMVLRHVPLTAALRPTSWDVTANGCFLLHKVVLHEAGHVFGLWNLHSPYAAVGHVCLPIWTEQTLLQASGV